MNSIRIVARPLLPVVLPTNAVLPSAAWTSSSSRSAVVGIRMGETCSSYPCMKVPCCGEGTFCAVRTEPWKVAPDEWILIGEFEWTGPKIRSPPPNETFGGSMSVKYAYLEKLSR